MTQYKIPVFGSGEIEKLCGFSSGGALVPFAISELAENSSPNSSDLIIIQDSSSGLLKRSALAPLLSGGHITVSDYACFADIKSQNTNGGTFTSGAWQTRTLNTAYSMNAFGELANNQITLPAGTYYCQIACPARQVGAHKARLYNVTESATLLIGTSEYSYTSSSCASTQSFIEGVFTLSQQSTLEIQHRCATSCSNYGFGAATNIITNEIYTVAQFWRRSDTSLPYAQFYDARSSGSNGGTASSGLNTRVLNTAAAINEFGTLQSNAITLPAGTYYCRASAPASWVLYCKAALYGASSWLVYGTSEYTYTSTNLASVVRSFACGQFTLSSSTSVTIRQYINTAMETTGLGRACGFGVNEIYTVVNLWKIS